MVSQCELLQLEWPEFGSWIPIRMPVIIKHVLNTNCSSHHHHHTTLYKWDGAISIIYNAYRALWRTALKQNNQSQAKNEMPGTMILSDPCNKASKPSGKHPSTFIAENQHQRIRLDTTNMYSQKQPYTRWYPSHRYKLVYKPH
jgi:hypothetical protein